MATKLEIDADQGLSWSGKPVLKFSQGFQKEIEFLQAKNYQIKTARVNFIVYWKNEDSGEEIKIVLPELIFGKNPQHMDTDDLSTEAYEAIN